MTVATGGSHSVSEAGSAAPATNLGDYVSTVSCTKNGGAFIAPTAGISLGSIAVAEGDAVVCTFVNTRKGSLTVVKDFTGPFDPSDRVSISVQGTPRNVAGTQSGNFGDGDATDPVTVAGNTTASFGEGFVAPATPAQYSSSAACVDTHGTAGTGDDTPVSSSFAANAARLVDVAAGARIVCTITNDRRTGRIRVVKDIVPVDGQLGDPGKFDLQVDGSTVRSDAGDGDGSSFVTKPTGSHSVGELGGTGTSLTDYDASVSCADQNGAPVSTSASAPWSLALAAGKDVTCTITNTRKRGHVKLVKDIVPVTSSLVIRASST